MCVCVCVCVYIYIYIYIITFSQQEKLNKKLNTKNLSLI